MNEDLAYMAGLFDGEGSVSITTRSAKTYGTENSFSLRVLFCNKHRPACELFLQFGGHVYLDGRKVSDRGAVYRWEGPDQAGIRCLETLIPWLQIKKPQALLALEFAQKKSLAYEVWRAGGGSKGLVANRRDPESVAEQRQIWLLMKAMNRRGGPEYVDATALP